MDIMDTPQISRSGRVLKKSAKVKEMEDFDINELDGTGKPRKRIRTSDEFDEFDDKKVAPIKIPKISLGMSGASPSQSKRPPQMIQKMVKPKQYYPDSDASKESDSSSMSSETSSSSPSSSDDSDGEMPPMQENKVIVESPYRQFESPAAFVEHTAVEGSDEDEESDSLVIAEDRGRSKRPPPPKRGAPIKKKPPIRVKKEKPANVKTKPLTAYMLWCTENRNRIVASSGNIGLGNIGKRLGEAWQALPDKEKMAWRRKAKRLALKNSGGLISTGPAPRGRIPISAGTSPDDSLKGDVSNRALGTAAIDSAAYLKLLGDSLSVIGQRLTEHEGQLAVSGIFSVLLDTILCVVGPLLCLTSESPPLAAFSPDLHKKTLESIAYFMPGL